MKTITMVFAGLAVTGFTSLAWGAETTVTVTATTQGKKSPVGDALVVVYDAGRNSVVAQGTTDEDGKVQVGVNPKPQYDIVAFHKGYRFLIKKNVRLSKPLDLSMSLLPKEISIAVVDGSGLSLFDEKEKDIQVAATYGGRTSCDFRCMNEQTLIGFDKPTLTTIQRCAPGQSFVVQKGRRRARCTVLWSLPSGFLIEYRVSP